MTVKELIEQLINSSDGELNSEVFACDNKDIHDASSVTVGIKAQNGATFLVTIPS